MIINIIMFRVKFHVLYSVADTQKQTDKQTDRQTNKVIAITLGVIRIPKGVKTHPCQCDSPRG